MVWKASQRWRPTTASTASAGIPVECTQTGALGFAKQSYAAREKVCADLAKLVGVCVPEVRIGVVEGFAGRAAVSIVHGAETRDIRSLRQRDRGLFASAAVKQALRKASGLLAFHAWVATGDLKDDHLLIAEFGGQLVVAAIDFEYSLAFGESPTIVSPPSDPVALVENADGEQIQATTVRIESCTRDQLEGIMDQLPADVLSAETGRSWVAGLLGRRDQVREAMKIAGWLV